jgi:hypothetical protein
MRLERFPRTEDALDPKRLDEMAGDLDRAGRELEGLAGATGNRGSHIRHMARATLCYSAARLLRRIAQ